MNSVYIHIPFCLAKCHYCGFSSKPLEQPAELKNYFQALAREIAERRTEIKSIKTIYVGGGTPTIAPFKLTEKILDPLRPWGPEAELTIEANPGTISLEKLKALREMGFNRLSL
ncbi:MAG: radical SAM protein, partial [Desulfocucumaceae bacterium]